MGFVIFRSAALFKNPVTNRTWHAAAALASQNFQAEIYLMTGLRLHTRVPSDPPRHFHEEVCGSQSEVPRVRIPALWPAEPQLPITPGRRFTRTLCMSYLSCMVRKVSSVFSVKVSIVRVVARSANV